MEPSQRNTHPVVTSAIIAVVAFAVLSVAMRVLGGSGLVAGALVAQGMLAAVALAVWASRSSTRWRLSGYLWRFALSWIAAIVLYASCTVLGRRP